MEQGQCTTVSKDVCEGVKNIIKTRFYVFSSPMYPQGCRVENGWLIYYNTYQGSDVQCSPRRKCVCQKGIQLIKPFHPLCYCIVDNSLFSMHINSRVNHGLNENNTSERLIDYLSQVVLLLLFPETISI